ncbi:MAG TPA: carboxypeptidase-like regulatory domain-containing protein [Bryobacteraceae bacterium]|nr:carboxypeptidase-like regulatory domain-containing protein [Bryobacteraceae bacterium]
MKNLIYSFILLAFVLASVAVAQDITAQISGTVLDPSGAGVPDAKVTVTNTDRNLAVRVITTDTGGNYSAPLLPIGNYSIKVEAKGFKTVDRSGIVLNVNDTLSINFTLQVGAVTETVEVTAQAARVELGTPANATTIEGTQVRELSLATRNYEQLVALMPGVTANSTDELYIGNSAPAGTAATMPFSVNGNRNSANNWTVDGADNVDRGSNLTLMTFPSIDSIAEFKVERSLYTADTGRAGGAQINVATKSGSSQFHGDLYEFVRNNAFAANNWINNAQSTLVNGKVQPPPLRWNDFGGTIGGPVYFGRFNKDHNKTFFFFSEEARRIITYTNFNPTLPTQGMIQGTFSQPVCLVYTTSCQSTGTQVANINPIAAQYIKDIYGKVPLPAVNSVAATSSEFFPVRNLYNSTQEIARVDHTFNDKFNVWGKFENDSIPTTEPGGLFQGLALPNVATTNTNSPGRAYVVHAVYTIRPNLLNDASFNFTQSAIHSTPVGIAAKANSPDINVPEPFQNTQGVIPTISIQSGTGILGYGPYNEFNKNYNLYDSVSWIRGRHTIRFGLSANRYNKTENAASDQGTFSFTNTGAPSGTSAFQQAFANFLLGNVATFTQPSTDITPNLWAWQDEAWAQDDFHVAPRLTVYLGVRWSYFGQPVDHNGELTSFDPALYTASAAPKIDPTSGNIVAGSTTLPYTNGIIIGGKNSPWGDKVAPDQYHNFAPRLGVAWDPIGDAKTSIRAGYGIYYDSGLFGTYEQSIFQNPPFVQSVTLSNAPFSNVAAGTPPGTVSTVYARATMLPNLIPYVQQWSLDVQRQLPMNMSLDVGYSGSKGTHLIGIVDLDQAPPGVALAAGLHAANGNTIFTSADDPHINAVRPFLGYNAINAIESAFDSNYNALLVSFRKQFTSAGLISFAYTYSKNLTDNASDRSNAPQSSYNWHEGEYGPATLDRQQVFNFNYVYTIPIFKNSHGALGYALKGWELSGIVSMYTGSPFTVTTSNLDPAGLGLLGNSASSSRPDMVCDPNQNAPHKAPGFTGPGQSTWFNTACFQAVPQGAVRPGNAGRGVVRGPGFGNWDAALMKNFHFTERVYLTLRGEFVNADNRANPNGFSSTNITSSSFGQISSYRAPRRIQIAAKLVF